MTKYFEENPIEAKATMKKALMEARGREAAKKAATYVTDEVVDDGIKNALIHFGLINGD